MPANQHGERLDVTQDFQRSQKRPFSKGATIKNLGENHISVSTK